MAVSGFLGVGFEVGGQRGAKGYEKVTEFDRRLTFQILIGLDPTLPHFVYEVV
jgi:hypothetical protein